MDDVPSPRLQVGRTESMLVCRLPFRPTLFSLAIILIAVLSSGTMGCVKLPALRLASSIAPAQRAAFTHATDPQGVRSFESPVATDSPDLSPLLVVISYGSGCSADGPGNGLRDLAEAVRSRFPSTLVQVITRTCEQTNDAIELKVQNHQLLKVIILSIFHSRIIFVF